MSQFFLKKQKHKPWSVSEMPVSAREPENTAEQILLLCQLCRAKVAANARKHLMKGSLHSLLLPSPTESLRYRE